MNKYLRKHGKKIMAIMGVLLMIAFALPSVTTQRGGRTDAAVGTLQNGKATLGGNEYANYVRQWHYLRQQYSGLAVATVLGGIGNRDEEIIVRVLTDPQITEQMRQLLPMRQQNPMIYNMFVRQQPGLSVLLDAEAVGAEAWAQFEASEELFPLLVKEAKLLGVGVNGDVIRSILAARGISRESDPDLYEANYQALHSLIAVSNAADLPTRMVKVSAPERANLLATRAQNLSLNLVEFAAKDFLDKVPAPTPDQLQKQFDKYKDTFAEGSPTGFGYKYPNRVTYDAIEIKKDEVKKAVKPVELEEVWEHYLRNKDSRDFVKDVPPSTQPAAGLSLTPPAPTTRPMTFDEAKEKIVPKLTNQRIDELTEKISDAIRATMKADYDAYKTATAAAGKATTAPASSLGVPYDSKDYLPKLRDKIQADFKVTPTIEREEGLQTATTLAASRLGKESFNSDARIPFTDYMTGILQPFLSEEQKKVLAARPDAKAAAAWEPTPTFRNANGDLLIARATKADTAHVPASLDEVKDKVAADVKQAAALELAKQAAQAAADAARSGQKWLQSIANEQGRPVITTGLFGPSQGDMTSIPNYDLKEPATSAFTTGAFKLLALPARTGQAVRPPAPATKPTTQASTQPTTKPAAATTQPIVQATTRPTTGPSDLKDHPIGLIELPNLGKVLVAEVNDIKTNWTKDRQSITDFSAGYQLQNARANEMRAAWFQRDNAVKRMGFVPAEGRKPQPDDNRGPGRIPNTPLGI